MIKEVRFYEAAEDARIKFAVILARADGKWVFCRHREAGETVDEAAARELREETGAREFTLRPVCVYAVIREDGSESLGGLYAAEIASFEKELHHEIGQILLLDEPPEDNWTYPEIQPKLLEEARRRGMIE